MKKKFLTQLWNYFGLTLGALIGSLYLYVFTLPNSLVPGGVSGISSILQFAGVLPAKYGILLFNIPLLVLAVIFLSKDFAFKTIYATVLGSLFLNLFDDIQLPTFTADRLVAVFLGGILSGISLYLATVNHGCNGGTEIIGRMIVKKNPEADFGNFLFCCNVVIMGVGGFFSSKTLTYDIWSVVYALLTSYVGSATYRVLDHGIDPALKYTIVTYKPREVSEAILFKFKRGVSLIETYQPDGSESNKAILVVVIQYRQNAEMKNLLARIDERSFSFCIAVDSVVTRPNFNKRYKKS